jgi:NTP pyrophosphatase (non-canonical NTP hydrolase)
VPEETQHPQPELKLNAYACFITAWREDKGFPMYQFTDEPFGLLSKLMLVVEELGEAASAIRTNDWPNFQEEIADALIRLFDLAAANGIDLEAQIQSKMERNAGRPWRHGKRA